MDYTPKFKNETYLLYNPFDGDMDVDIRNQKTRIVKVRQIHECAAYDLFGMPLHHSINPGDLAFYEHALVDGEWGQSWCCLECMDRFLIDDAGLKPDKEEK